MIKEDEIVYGTILQDPESGCIFKVVGGVMVNNEEYYECQPLVSSGVLLKSYVLEKCQFIKDNLIGIPIKFR